MQDDFFDDTVLSPRPTGPVASTTADMDDTVLVPSRLLRGTAAAAAPPELIAPPVAPPPVVRAPSAHYRFRVASVVVGLDRVAYIGRRPTLPRVARADGSQLVRVLSPLREVSGTHLEIRQSGAFVVVTDLGSTNGSVVNIPGRAPQTLRRGESLVVTPGTLVDIGDGNLIEILPMQRS